MAGTADDAGAGGAGAVPAASHGLQVLVLDDELFIAEELALGLEEAGMRVLLATSAREAEALLAGHEDIGVVVTDIRMPGEDGLTLVRRLLANRGAAKAVETVVMTGHATIEDAVAAVRAGAFDFVRKPFALDDMINIVTAALERVAGTRQQAEAPLRQFAEVGQEALPGFDPVTGLLDRSAFATRVAALRMADGRLPPKAAVIMLEVDRFTAVREAAGGAAADAVLTEVARRLQRIAGEAWCLARTGSAGFGAASAMAGDEAELLALAERMRAAAEAPFPHRGRVLRPAVNLGFAHAASCGDVGLDVAACAALSVARRQGAGHCVAFTPVMEETAARRRMILRDLPSAVTLGQVALHYQPIFRVADRALLGFEALLRWRHPSLGPVSPTEFILVAEEEGCILELGAWAIGEAAWQAALWRAEVERGLFLAVNISSRQIAEADVPALFEAALAAQRLPPSALMAEVTETVAVGPRAAEAVCALRKLGIRVALDDFGAGYSSLGALGGLSMDSVKLDRALAATGGDEIQERHLFRGLVSTIHALGLQVVVEGIETEAQMQMVKEAGCEAAQGYLLGRPLPATAADALLSARR